MAKNRDRAVRKPVALKLSCIVITRRNQSFWPVLIQRSVVKTQRLLLQPTLLIFKD
ncbi:hypothetical protein N9V74_01570 [Alteromonas sp.]|nr:hypothetical protein [Alteromonas sp.]